MSDSEVPVSPPLQSLVPCPVVAEDNGTARNHPFNVGNQCACTAVWYDLGPVASSAALENILDPNRGVPSKSCLDVLHLKLIHLVGASGGELDWMVQQVIQIAPTQVVVVVGHTLTTEAQISGTDGDTHVLAETADDEHLGVDIVVGVMEEGSSPNGAGASALRVGALEDGPVLVL